MPVMYEVPEEFYLRIHHIRSRFKNDVESVLIYMAVEICKIGRLPKEEFKTGLNNAIRLYPGNATKVIKTINNWRTEISALFGLIEFDSNNCWPSKMAVYLAAKQDLVEFFKYHLYYFQYPGGHLKPHETKYIIENGIRFKPAKYMLKLLAEGEKITGQRFCINKAEATNCVFNDMRVTRDGRDVSEVIDLILRNREQSVTYNWTGDVIRYAGDILDYMVNANLLVLYGNKFYLNKDETGSITALLESDVYFGGYDSLYGVEEIPIAEIKSQQEAWFRFVNQEISIEIFKTDVFKYMGIEEANYAQLAEQVLEGGDVGTKEIGDLGETLVHGHECMRVKLGKREDLVHLIKRVPTALFLGFDIHSVEIDERKRFVEVKTTISMKKVNFKKFHLTLNEWKAAESVKDRYFVYRLMVTKDRKRLFIIQDPVGKYKKNIIEMAPRDGADITFTDDAGQWEELLVWES